MKVPRIVLSRVTWLWSVIYVLGYVLCSTGLGYGVIGMMCAFAVSGVVLFPWGVSLGVIVGVPVVWELYLGRSVEFLMFILTFLAGTSLYMGGCYRVLRSSIEVLRSTAVYLVVMQIVWVSWWAMTDKTIHQRVLAVREAAQWVSGVLIDENRYAQLSGYVLSLMTTLLPFMMFCIALASVTIIHAGVRLFTRGRSPKVAPLPAITQWQLHPIFIWLYLAVMVLDVFTENESLRYSVFVVRNAVPIGLVLFSIQGVAFIFFVSMRYRQHWLPWTVFVGSLCIPLPFVVTLYSMIGIMDTAFPLRQRMLKSSKK